MDCNVIKDLIPLYIDACCSEESAGAVGEHIEHCESCRKFYESMTLSVDMPKATSAPTKLSRLNLWKASVLQSVLFFVSFAIITLGVALEAKTPYGNQNGYWAFVLVIPATGFLLSLANWYFVRFYKNRETFSRASMLITVVITVLAYVWAGFHYELDFSGLLQSGLRGIIVLLGVVFSVYGGAIVLTAISFILSKALSYRYADMIGKE